MDLYSRVASLRGTPRGEWTPRQMRTLLAHAGMRDVNGLVERAELLQAVDACLAGHPPIIVPLCRSATRQAAPATGSPGSSGRSASSLAGGQGAASSAAAPARPAAGGTGAQGGAAARASSRKAAEDANVAAAGPGGVAAAVDGAKAKGNASFAAGDFAKAVSHYGMAIRLSPTPSAVLYSNRAAAFGGMAYWGKSLDDADMAIKLEPKWAKAHARRGAALLAMRQWAEAGFSFSAALDTEPGYVAAMQGLKEAGDGLEWQKRDQ